jgi:hypothetical protein
MSRLIILSVVVLPQPEGPTRATISPAGISRSRSRPWHSTRTAGRSRPRRRSTPPSSWRARTATPRSPPTTSSRPAGPARGRGPADPAEGRHGPPAAAQPGRRGHQQAPQGLRRRGPLGRELSDLDDADAARAELHDEYLSTEHLLLALADRVGVAATTCCRAAEVRGSHRVTSQNPEEQYQALEKYGRDLTEAPGPGQDRPGHRPRRGDPPGHPGAVAAAPRTTRCSSASPASARPPSSRAWPGASSRATCPRA